jgi:hypothetical protein
MSTKKSKKKKKKRLSKKRSFSNTSVVLDLFTQPDLDAWAKQGHKLQSLCDRVYFELEQQRAKSYDALCDSLRTIPAASVDVKGWARVTDWRWSMTPLSAAGSLKGIGGRFNIGNDLDRARNQSFPSLYLAQDVDTAFGEYFGGPLSTRSGALSLGELALRRESSFTTFLLDGHLDQVFDLRSGASLKTFASISNAFDISPLTKAAIRAAGLPPRRIIRSADELWNRLLDAPAAWRREPQAYGIPAPCQIFGRFVRDAGFEAILYPSRHGLGLCLAVYPENFRASTGCVRVVGDVPDRAANTILDKDHLQ